MTFAELAKFVGQNWAMRTAEEREAWISLA
jgi:hypothetical protein